MADFHCRPLPLVTIFINYWTHPQTSVLFRPAGKPYPHDLTTPELRPSGQFIWLSTDTFPAWNPKALPTLFLHCAYKDGRQRVWISDQCFFVGNGKSLNVKKYWYTYSIFPGFNEIWHALHSCLLVLPEASNLNAKLINNLQSWFTSLCALEIRINRRARFSGRDF